MGGRSHVLGPSRRVFGPFGVSYNVFCDMLLDSRLPRTAKNDAKLDLSSLGDTKHKHNGSQWKVIRRR